MRAFLTRLSFLILAIPGLAQNGSVQDMELWLKAGAQVEFGDALQLEAEQQIRFDENASEVKNYHTEVALTYELDKNIDLFFVNRFIRRNDNRGENQGYESHFRYQFGTQIKHRFRQFRFKHRLLYQHRNELGLTTAEGDVARRFLRYRFLTEYKIKNWSYDPRIKVEYFNDLPKEFATTNDQLRFGIGTERSYKKLGQFSFDYLIERSLDLPVTEWTYILVFRYEYRF